jgi:hypothetical protein
MTGAAKDATEFVVQPMGEGRTRARLIGRVNLDDPYVLYHEFGTSRYEGHFPLRQTMDFIGPRIRVYIAEATRPARINQEL